MPTLKYFMSFIEIFFREGPSKGLLIVLCDQQPEIRTRELRTLPQSNAASLTWVKCRVGRISRHQLKKKKRRGISPTLGLRHFSFSLRSGLKPIPHRCQILPNWIWLFDLTGEETHLLIERRKNLLASDLEKREKRKRNGEWDERNKEDIWGGTKRESSL